MLVISRESTSKSPRACELPGRRKSILSVIMTDSHQQILRQIQHSGFNDLRLAKEVKDNATKANNEAFNFAAVNKWLYFNFGRRTRVLKTRKRRSKLSFWRQLKSIFFSKRQPPTKGEGDFAHEFYLRNGLQYFLRFGLKDGKYDERAQSNWQPRCLQDLLD